MRQVYLAHDWYSLSSDNFDTVVKKKEAVVFLQSIHGLLSATLASKAAARKPRVFCSEEIRHLAAHL